MAFRSVLSRKTIFDKALPLRERNALAEFFDPLGCDLTGLGFHQPGSPVYKQIVTNTDGRLDALRQRHGLNVVIEIFANDGFFGLNTPKALLSAGWTHKDVAQLSILHEFAHVASWIASPQSIVDHRGAALNTWSMAFSSWPLATLPGLPARELKKLCPILADCAPGISGGDGRADLLPSKAPIEWAQNFSELRADAISVALCAGAECEALKDHPLRKNFAKAIQELALARLLSPPIYRWGELSQWMERVFVDDQRTPLSGSALVALGESIAWICANGNWPFFAAQENPPSPLSTHVFSSFPGNINIAAAEQTAAASETFASVISQIKGNMAPDLSGPASGQPKIRR